ncbi:hypothetical protein [Scopulibacillus cellulosilyticus]|uniref:Uncharacterized protein n=1 Tax=Scopulibacillus cellulosilyticus TaxID=2665665 RepID=A0ABW2PXI7_9BACL
MDKWIDHYHCCASCRHFRIRSKDGGKISVCSRLGYETKPFYKFNCWDPKPRVQQALENKLDEKSS